MQKPNDVIAIGSILVDLLVNVEESLIDKMQLKKGEMHLIEEEQAKKILEEINYLQPQLAPGGSAANTIRALGLLGSKVILYGKIGDDQHGKFFLEELSKHNVVQKINLHHKPTGHCVSLITPDAERTFSVFLGAAMEIVQEDIVEEDIALSKILHLEAYQLEGQTRPAALHALELAKKHNTLVSLDLADPALIRRNKELFKGLVENKIDIIFANEQEAKEFTGLEEEAALLELAKHAKIAVVKLGVRGSLIRYNDETIKISAFPAEAVDTTGAGDTFAAGFLHGYCQGWSMEKSGKLGSLLAAKIVENMGVDYLKCSIKETLNELD